MGGVFWWWQGQQTVTEAEIAPAEQQQQSTEESDATVTSVDNVLGHLPYAEAPSADLQDIGRGIRLRTAAAEEFEQMVADAAIAGIPLVPLSGYRSQEEQEYLFFEIQAQRNQNPSERAEISAPPGFSEHHTGYAIDIGDGTVPAANLNESFAETPAFAWLEANAARYGFELSFPEDNPQGITYEPWHWRFVGDRDSLETFYRAKQLPQPEERDRD